MKYSIIIYAEEIHRNEIHDDNIITHLIMAGVL